MSPNVEGRPRASESPSTSPESVETDGLPPDDIFHILQTNRRRDAIAYLLKNDSPVKMRDVAEFVAAKENGTTVAQLTSAQRQRVYIPLYQSHLPKLDREGIIEYNKSRGIVRPTDRLEIFRPYLEMSDDEFDRSARSGDRSARLRSEMAYYSAATAASVGLLIAAKIGFLALSGFLLGAIITLLFVTTVTVTSHARSRTPNRSADA
ncbi:DUF7344 domain-containing protein [Halosolutus gelatinilyticus]|uniref:DUF7344 domain-containing protein n=1 Tax=Halosolutus gelatinilyticus TaxID=2931975 RepID=UPI001FF513C4|nr:hypothetical protein [Halosolutus gelatinilyticus]